MLKISLKDTFIFMNTLSIKEGLHTNKYNLYHNLFPERKA